MVNTSNWYLNPFYQASNKRAEIEDRRLGLRECTESPSRASSFSLNGVRGRGLWIRSGVSRKPTSSERDGLRARFAISESRVIVVSWWTTMDIPPGELGCKSGNAVTMRLYGWRARDVRERRTILPYPERLVEVSMLGGGKDSLPMSRWMCRAWMRRDSRALRVARRDTEYTRCRAQIKDRWSSVFGDVMSMRRKTHNGSRCSRT